MSVNGFGNGYQPSLGNFQGNGFGNNYNNYTNNTTGINSPNINPPPITIGFVQGKIGAATFPIMSSNTTAYLFDVQDQTKFYVKATDAFGMAVPLREFEYHEVFNQSQSTPLVPVPSKGDADVINNDNIVKNTDGVSKEEFEELKAQLNELIQNSQKGQYQQKQRKERQGNV